MNRFRFLEWEVYKDAKKVFSIVLKLVRSLPQEHRFDLGNQIVRSALSIVLNITEEKREVVRQRTKQIY